MQRYDKDLNPAIALNSFFRIKFNIIGFQRIKNAIKIEKLLEEECLEMKILKLKSEEE